jgi:hypothetical protein
VHGSIYERKSQGYFKGTGQGQKKLELYRGMPFQILPPKFIRAHGSSDTAAKIINEEIAELQKSKFSEKFASQYQQAATLF